MPYILQPQRDLIDKGLDVPRTSGELNYKLTTVCTTYLGLDFNYQRINDVIGALEACKLECYRRIAGPYEDKKAQINGDVFPCSTKT